MRRKRTGRAVASRKETFGGVTPAGFLILVGAGALNGEFEMQDLEQAIRERAYQLWSESGCREGYAESHWLAAQRDILGASLGELVRVTPGEASAVAAKPRAKASRKKPRAA
jgi:hypothetical protein